LPPCASSGGGDIAGDVRSIGGAGAFPRAGTRTAFGGSFNGATFTALKIASVIAGNAALNSTVLAGADPGSAGAKCVAKRVLRP
jgi:hypothetical protein